MMDDKRAMEGRSGLFSAKAEVLALLDHRTPRQSLPRPFYTDPELFRWDMAAIWEQRWVYAGLECDIAEVGQFFTLTIGDSSILVCRGRDLAVRAFFNTCRHRGSIVADAPRGQRTVFVCPYHQWSYDLDGALLRAPNLDAAVDVSAMGLRPVHVRAIAGLIYVCLADAPPDIEPFAAALGPAAWPHDLARAKVVHGITLPEQANWKLVMENARECDHCRASHPELMNALLIFDFADPWSDPAIAAFWARCEASGLPSVTQDGEDFRVGRMPFQPGNLSITMDGQPAVARRLGDGPDQDIGSLRFTHYPSVFGHIHADYAIVVRMLPTSATETLVTCQWLVHRDAVEGRDYDLERLVEVWRATNDQDRQLVERNQRGVNSVGYRPGPYAPTSEHGVWTFVEWYCRTMREHLRIDPIQRTSP
jgi:Rieske 2Fe-2S family protein